MAILDDASQLLVSIGEHVGAHHHLLADAALDRKTPRIDLGHEALDDDAAAILEIGKRGFALRRGVAACPERAGASRGACPERAARVEGR
jgi:hypothetical protein